LIPLKQYTYELAKTNNGRIKKSNEI
jgi:hypothetical protein